MAERKPNLLLPILGGAAILTAGGVGAYFYFNKAANLTTESSATADGTIAIIPKHALMAISISTDGAALSQLEQQVSPDAKNLIESSIAQVKQNLASADFDYDKDIQPWLGRRVAIAILPSGKTATIAPDDPQRSLQSHYIPTSITGSILLAKKAPSTSTTIPNLLIVAEVKDKQGEEKFGEKIKVKAGGKEKQSEYKGIKLLQFGEGSGTTIMAMVGDYLVVAPHEPSVQKAIDTFKGEASLSTTLNAERLKLKNPIVRVYIPNFSAVVPELSALNPKTSHLPPETWEQLKKIKTLYFGLGIDDAGLRFKFFGKFDPSLVAGLKNTPNRLLAQLPAQTFAVMGGSNINERWKHLAKSTPEIQKSIKRARQELKAAPLEIDLDKDIFRWMDGEFAIAVIGTTQTDGILLQTQGIAPAMFVQTSDRHAAEALLKKLDKLITQNGGKVAKHPSNDGEITEWTLPNLPTAVLAYGWQQKDTVFMTFPPLVSLFVPKPSTTLESDPTFKSITSSLPVDNAGYFYLDIEKAWSIAEKFITPNNQKQLPPEAKTLITSIRGLAITTVYPSPETSEVEAVLSLKKDSR